MTILAEISKLSVVINQPINQHSTRKSAQLQ